MNKTEESRNESKESKSRSKVTRMQPCVKASVL